jgi:hypothetical protein
MGICPRAIANVELMIRRRSLGKDRECVANLDDGILWEPPCSDV